ncbi:hypothetical protein N2152v2_007704 [Parachlorella kessleri]
MVQQAGQHARRPLFLELPEDVLDLVMLRLPFVERVRKAPLVCKHLHALSKSSKQQWAEIVLPTVHIRDQVAITRLAAFVRWLEARGSGVRTLDLAIVPSAELAQSHARIWALVCRALDAVAPYLVRLHLEWLGMLAVGDWAARMHHIEQADFIGQRLVLGPALRDLPRLQDLWLVGDSITYQPLGGGQHPAAMSCLPPSITALSFSRASLRQLPPGIASLTALISLDLSYSFPDSDLSLDPLSRLTALQELTCSWCRLSHVPRQLSALTSLRVLYLHECFAGEVPSEEEFEVAFRPLQRLGMLSLSSCRLRSVPRALLGMTSLRVLHWRKPAEAAVSKGLHLEDNRGSLLLPPGPYLGRLVELVIDWSTLFGSHGVLRDATQLTKLYASGSHRLPHAAPPGGAAAAADGIGGVAPGGLAEVLGPGGEGAGWAPAWHPGAAGGAFDEVPPPLIDLVSDDDDDDEFDLAGAEVAAGVVQQEQLHPPGAPGDVAQQGGGAFADLPWPLPPVHVQPPQGWVPPELAALIGLQEVVALGPGGEHPGVMAGGLAQAAAAAAEAAEAAAGWAPADGPPPGAEEDGQGEGGVAGLFAQEAPPGLGIGGMAPAGLGQAAAAGGGGGAWWPEAPPAAPGALAGGGWAAGQGQQGDEAQAPDGAAAADVAASMAAMPSLRHFVDVFPPGRPVYVEPGVAQFMYLLPHACPRLDVKVLQSNSFGWRLADLLRREEEEVVQGAG